MIDDIIALAKELIGCASITPTDAGCQQILNKMLTTAGFRCEAMRFGDVDNLWARYGTESPLLIFAGHTDVVPAGPLADWKSPPFTPTVRDDCLYGRGTTDMKGEIAAMIIAALCFIKAKPHFKGSIGFLFTSDEEGAAINGTKKVIDVLQKRGEQINYCIVGEPSSESIVGDQIRIGRRGSLHAKLLIRGKQGHVAHPLLAKNPIHLSLPALLELTQTKWDKGNADFPPTTMQMSNIQSGTGAANVIPGHLDLLFNFRFSTAISIQELQARTQAILYKHGLSFDLQWDIAAKPFLTRTGILIETAQQAINELVKLNTRLSTGGGTSDARYIAPIGAEVIELGTPYATAHQIDERVRIDDLHLLTKIYKRILEILLS